MSIDSFEVEISGDHLWNTLNKFVYSSRALQAATELIDNAISAISSKGDASSGKILFDFDETTSTASIEDNGPGFPIDPSELKRCWSYGSSKPNGLNEHGCGAKTALAIFDVKGNGWKVYWKVQDSPNIYMIRGPLQRTMEIAQVTEWPGKLNGSSGVFMSFPCSQECFRALYGRNAKNMNDAIPRFKRELAQMYYCRPEIASKLIQMKVNGQVVEPFTIDLGGNSVRSHAKHEFTIGTDTFSVMCIVLNEEIKDSWFKVNAMSMGIYIWKNGRYISQINSGELFENITGRRAHPSMAGKIVLVNMIGDQKTLPPTDPNKTTWNINNDRFREFVQKLSGITTQFFRNDKTDDYERDHVKNYIETKRMFLGAQVKGYTIDSNISINGETPPIDIVEEFPIENKVNIYEGKRTNLASIESVGQLHTNYILAKKSLESSGRTIDKAILLLNCGSDDCPMDTKLEQQIRVLKEISQFPLEIHSYKNGLMWPRQVEKPVIKKTRSSKASSTT
jgi:hypothetical protein